VKADVPRVPQLRIPAWVPKQVADKAREFARRDPPVISPARLKALATNKRMKWVWRELSKRQGNGYYHPVRALPKKLAPVVDWQAAGMAFLFSQVIEIVRAELFRTMMTASRKETETARDAYASTAGNLRSLAQTFAEVAARHIPADYPDPHRVEAFLRRDAEQRRKLIEAAEVLEELVQIEQEAAAEFPKRDRNNASARRVTGELVKSCRIIFGKSLFGVVAIIASIVLESKISESTIRGWYPRG